MGYIVHDLCLHLRNSIEAEGTEALAKFKQNMTLSKLDLGGALELRELFFCRCTNEIQFTTSVGMRRCDITSRCGT